MTNRGMQGRYAHPIGLGDPPVTRLPGTIGISYVYSVDSEDNIRKSAVATSSKTNKQIDSLGVSSVESRHMKEVPMFAGIDGTGDSNDQQYEVDFEHSFVKHFTQQGPSYSQYYTRGPGTIGGSTLMRAELAYEAIKKQFLSSYEDGQYLKIMLAGYSRGGVAACAVAKFLAKDNIPVHALLLMDPVDRTFTLWGNDTVIPENVSYVDRTQRHSSTSSRETFGTDCTKFWDGRFVPTTYFITTHGGMGGCPWGSKKAAQYYKFGVVSSSVKTSHLDGYYNSPPQGGTVDYTKQKMIHEGGLDGSTSLSAPREHSGYLSAQSHYTRVLTEIRRQPACLLKLGVFKNALEEQKLDRKKRYASKLGLKQKIY